MAVVSWASYSSRISPITSSTRSSRVTIPAVPPYSSTTIARWWPSRRISLIASSTFLVAGSSFTGRAISRTRRACSPRARYRSRTCTKPTTES